VETPEDQGSAKLLANWMLQETLKCFSLWSYNCDGCECQPSGAYVLSTCSVQSLGDSGSRKTSLQVQESICLALHVLMCTWTCGNRNTRFVDTQSVLRRDIVFLPSPL